MKNLKILMSMQGHRRIKSSFCEYITRFQDSQNFLLFSSVLSSFVKTFKSSSAFNLFGC